ncbi:uncharacterized protein LTR77_000605 [Saxophila tyrrhenica]|uniref:Major facilitator superfamily (MFS) profile domain-containing protein n=1 Tax=Saxophila tyrrhenica TaxID=1690608 RepID=A0AAV9PNB3_9PEZI|nr:hypothetical protein LTR77_000605 [Saxophila tyrrhenica]
MAEQQVVGVSDRSEKEAHVAEHFEHGVDTKGNLSYEHEEEEPELHMRTYVALLSMWLLNLVQVLALQGPPAVLNYIGEDLKGSAYQTWVPNSLSLVQAVLGPVISSASDAFQARKIILVGSCVVSFVGSAIAPGSQSIGRLIAAQTLIGFGFAAVPLAYCVPSEILPRRWRPMAQAVINVAAALGAISGPMAIGGLVHRDPVNGWRNFYWIQFALWGATALGIQFGYKPPKRRTVLDELSLWQKIGKLDLIGFALLTTGLALLLTGLNLGGGLYPWASGNTLGPLVVGAVVLVAFGLYEWKGTKTGILNHELFQGGKAQGRTFTLCVFLIFIEGILLFSYVIFYPVLTENLYEADPLLLVARAQPYWIAAGLMTCIYGYASTKLRSIRGPLGVGFLILTAGTIGFATLQPGQSTIAVVMSGFSGVGFGAPLVLIVAGVHLSAPHHLIATATAVTTSARAVAATVFTAIYAASFSSRAATLVPAHVASAAVGAGLSPDALPEFIPAFLEKQESALAAITGVTPAVLAAAAGGAKQGIADSLRVVYMIAAPFGAVAVIACFFMGDLSKTMNYIVEAPVEDLHAKLNPDKLDEKA